MAVEESRIIAESPVDGISPWLLLERLTSERRSKQLAGDILPFLPGRAPGAPRVVGVGGGASRRSPQGRSPGCGGVRRWGRRRPVGRLVPSHPGPAMWRTIKDGPSLGWLGSEAAPAAAAPRGGAPEAGACAAGGGAG
jgi:hypothetical protein